MRISKEQFKPEITNPEWEKRKRKEMEIGIETKTGEILTEEELKEKKKKREEDPSWFREQK